MTRQGAEFDKILAQWRQERPDIDPLCMVVCGAVWRAGKRLSAGVGKNLEQYKMDFAGMDVLLTLRRFGPDHPLKPSKMAHDMMLSTAAMTSRLDRLESRGLIHRTQSKEDRRSVGICLTAEGLALADEIVVTHVEIEKQMLAKLSTADQKMLIAMLEKLAVS